MEIKPPQVPLEVIEVKIGTQPGRVYSGFGGSYATVVDSCRRKKVLPGLYQEDLVRGVELSGKELTIFLSGERTEAEVTKIIDIAMENVSTFLTPGANPEYKIEVKFSPAPANQT
ncbi:MAG: hypothetical protein QHH02_06465 [Syntrophomonadaceae bacterium]|nr:hypothetical protein [Syntrophomonadaceae bacterium]